MYILYLTSKIPSLLPRIFLHALLVINKVLISCINTFKISANVIKTTINIHIFYVTEIVATQS